MWQLAGATLGAASLEELERMSALLLRSS